MDKSDECTTRVDAALAHEDYLASVAAVRRVCEVINQIGAALPKPR